MDTKQIERTIIRDFCKRFNDYGNQHVEISVKNYRNSVLNLLNYYRLGILMNDIGMARDDSDGDAFYFKNICNEKECLNADVAFSFWTPYSCLMKNLPKCRKNNGMYSKNYKHISTMIALKDDKYIKEINALFESFAENYFSRGNLILLPNRKMNNERYRLFEDRMDAFLDWCFADGLMEFSNDESNLIRWIKSENLECMFKNGTIKRENIKRLVEGVDINERISRLTDEQIKEYVRNAKKIIDKRNKAFLKMVKA